MDCDKIPWRFWERCSILSLMARLTSFGLSPQVWVFGILVLSGGIGGGVGCKLRWIRIMCTAFKEYHHVARTVQVECLLAILR
jgi:hypothetical protein